MKLVTFTHDNRTRIGVAVDDAVIDLSKAAPDLPDEMCAFLDAGEVAMNKARDAESDRA